MGVIESLYLSSFRKAKVMKIITKKMTILASNNNSQ